jgi:hypothetical protein
MNSDACALRMRGLTVLEESIQPLIRRSVAAIRPYLLLAGPQLSLERLAKWFFHSCSETWSLGNGP